jgi:hypothetical protein
MITPKGKLNQPNKIQDSLLALINVIKLMTRKTAKVLCVISKALSTKRQKVLRNIM